jgi:hypothetical protein
MFILSFALLACSKDTGQQEDSTGLKQVQFLQSEEIQLSPPQLWIDSVLFRQSAQVRLALDFPKTTIYYSLDDGPEQKYRAPFDLVQSSQIRVQARSAGFQSSDWLKKTLVKVEDKFQIFHIELSPKASEKYQGKGASTLIDLRKGSLDFKADQSWLGFQTATLNIQLKFQTSTTIEKVFLSFLTDHHSWIFSPKAIQIWSGGKQIGAINLANPEKEAVAQLTIISLNLEKRAYKELNIKIINHEQIPSWHPGKGTPPWLFIDEILMN